jgi:hypothetical protein
MSISSSFLSFCLPTNCSENVRSSTVATVLKYFRTTYSSSVCIVANRVLGVTEQHFNKGWVWVTSWYRAYVWYILNLQDTLNTGYTCSPEQFCSEKSIGMNAEKCSVQLLTASEGTYTHFL